MANWKKLAGDTVIYGLSSIVGRFLNYLLVPLYTYKIAASSGGYGVVTHLYAYTAILLVILTYGMETSLFYFANREKNPERVFSTILRMVGFTSLLFVALILAFLGPISQSMGYADHPSYIWTMAIIVALDAFQAVLFSYLRFQNRPIKFASLKLLFIGLNIGLNLLYFLLLPNLYPGNPGLWGKIYNPEVGVGYVFYINLFCTSIVTFFFLKEIGSAKSGFDKELCKRMLSYTWPILLIGVFGHLNHSIDKILFPKVYPGADAQVQLGIYGAGVKIAMIMGMITQAFRYAYEPAVFGTAGKKEGAEFQANGMKFYIIFTLLAYLAVMAYMNVLRYIINRDYWEGLRVVPIVMLSELLFGIYFNLSFWYKTDNDTHKTVWGALFSGIGLVVLLLINFFFVPKYNYMACAWGAVAGFGVATLLSYFVGLKKSDEPIQYPMKDISLYFFLAVVLFIGITLSNKYLGLWPALVVNTVLIFVYLAYIVKKDLPLSELPVVGKYFKK